MKVGQPRKAQPSTARSIAEPLAQDDAAGLIDQLDDASPEIRDRAEERLRALGEMALPALKRSTLPRARAIAARIEWEPFVPFWVGRKDPGIFLRLASDDGAVAAAAYDYVVQRDGLRRYLNRKVLRDGPTAMKRRVFAGFEAWDYGSRETAEVLEVLAAWDAKSPPAEEELQGLTQAVALSARPEHAARLRALAAMESDRLRLVGTIGLAAIGDAEAQKRALGELRGESSWRCIAASRAFTRSPNAEAAPLLRKLLTRSDAELVHAALDALSAYPELDVREALVALLGFKDSEAIQTEALHQIALRKFDEAKRIWPLVQNGTLKYEPSNFGADRGPEEGDLPYRLGEAMLVADDPEYLDRIHATGQRDYELYIGLYETLMRKAPPRIEARLKAIAAGKEESSELLVPMALDYAKKHPELHPPPPADETLARLAAKAEGETYQSLPPFKELSKEQQEKLLGLCRSWVKDKSHPLRQTAAILLHQQKIEEGTEALLELAAPDTYSALNLLAVYFQRDDRARPLLREKLKCKLEMDRWYALWLLSMMKDDSVPAAALDMLRKGECVMSGSAIGSVLTQYPERDFTDDLLAILSEATPPGHVEQILFYLLWRGRKDQVKLMRSYLDHKNPNLRGVAVRAVGEWADKESFRVLAERLDNSPQDFETSPLLAAMMRIDAPRTLPKLRHLFAERDYQRRWAAFEILARHASPQDRDDILRLLRTDGHARGFLPKAAGRLGLAGATEILLEMAADGVDSAALGLAYLGDRRAVPALIEHLDGYGRLQFADSLDFIVNRSRYPDLRARKDPGRVSENFDSAKKKLRDAYGMEFTTRIEASWFEFAGEEDLLEILERNCSGNVQGGRFAHLWRDGLVELVRPDEAVAYWKSWWAKHSKGYDRK